MNVRVHTHTHTHSVFIIIVNSHRLSTEHSVNYQQPLANNPFPVFKNNEITIKELYIKHF